MNRITFLTLFTAGLAVATGASASIIFGNPTITTVLDSGSPVEIGLCRAYTCPGYETVDIDSTLTTSTTVSATLSEDTWCAIGIEVQWSGTSVYDTVDVQGFDDFTTESAGTARTIRLDPVLKTATLE